jgi:putative DNA methylase
MSGIKSPKKLIEVALPLDDINAEAAQEKSIRQGHPSSLHLWWARRPLAAARAVLFAQMVNDPGGERGWQAGLTKQQAAAKRELLFDIIRDLVKWENINNEEVLERARIAIKQSWRETCAMNKGKPGFDPDVLPAFHDPFAGGGAIPLEAQRLGLESYASDLNPVAVMINKAMIEIPPMFANSKPVGPIPDEENQTSLFKKEWRGAEGLAEDVRRYGYWMRKEAQRRIGHLYPDVEITKDMVCDRPDLKQYVGRKLKVIAWLWARTVKSPNPQFSHVDVPLVSSFVLSKKSGKEAYVQSVIDGDSYRFEVKIGKPPKDADNGTKLSRGSFRCLLSSSVISYEYVDDEANAGRMGKKLFAIVLEGDNSRIYVSPTREQEDIALSAVPTWKPTTQCRGTFASNAQGRIYGFKCFGDYFANRQLVALNTFSELVQEARTKAIADAKAAGMPDDGIGVADGGKGATAYGDALAVYLAFALDKSADLNNSLVRWESVAQCPRQLFGRQAIPMIWDFAEANLLSNSSGGWATFIDGITRAFSRCFSWPKGDEQGFAIQADAQMQTISENKVISTDPPYYDNIGYADLSDFFYVWMRRGLRDIFPELFATMAVPKAEELVATPYRHGCKEKAEEFFLDGMTSAMHHLAEKAHPGFPVTIYYAFKSSDTDDSGTGNTGWETFLEAVLQAGFAITGTWPMRTENGSRMIGQGANALASSIVLVCRKRDEDAEEIGRREFLSELRTTMPSALNDMLGKDGISSPIAPVDLAQAAIGPGMEIFSKYRAVLNSDGTQMTVHEAMIEINRQITDYLNPDGSGFDPATLFCNDWFQQYGWSDGPFGVADTLARAKGTNVASIKASGAITAEGGIVQIMNWKDYPADYDPASDKNRSTWEACHHMIRVLNQQGEEAAGALLAKMSEDGENIRQLAYFLYTLCERKGNAEDARYYNELMTSWHSIVTASMEYMKERPQQEQFELF